MSAQRVADALLAAEREKTRADALVAQIAARAEEMRTRLTGIDAALAEVQAEARDLAAERDALAAQVVELTDERNYARHRANTLGEQERRVRAVLRAAPLCATAGDAVMIAGGLRVVLASDLAAALDAAPAVASDGAVSP